VAPRYIIILPITHTPPDKDTIGSERPGELFQAA
jgi:hypothetical protein